MATVVKSSRMMKYLVKTTSSATILRQHYTTPKRNIYSKHTIFDFKVLA